MINFFNNIFLKIVDNNQIFCLCIVLILGSSIFLICLPFFIFFIKFYYFICLNLEINAFTFQCFCLNFVNRITIYYTTFLIEKLDFACYLPQFLIGYSFSVASNYLEGIQLNSFFAFLLFLILIFFNIFFFILWFTIQPLEAIDFFFSDLPNLKNLFNIEKEIFAFYFKLIHFFTKLIQLFNSTFNNFWNIANDFEKICFIFCCFIFCYFCYELWNFFKKNH